MQVSHKLVVLLIGSLTTLFPISSGLSAPATLTLMPTLEVSAASKGEIAFVSDRDGNWEIYLSDVDGRQVRNLTQNSADDESPVWSPDGRQIAFVSNRTDYRELYIMDVDYPVNVRRMTQLHKWLIAPAWSPDGQYIAFLAGKYGPNGALYVLDIGRNSIRELMGESVFYSLQWLPNSKYITAIYQSTIFTVNIDTGEVVNLSTHNWPQYMTATGDPPRVSPDGAKLAFDAGFYDRKDWEFHHYLSVTAIDGTDLHSLIEGSSGKDFAWSPDSKQIVFVLWSKDSHDLFSINANGTNLTRLTWNRFRDLNEPEWSPDGTQIVFTGELTEIYIISLSENGNILRPLTDRNSHNYLPRWRPQKMSYIIRGIPSGKV